MERKSSQSVGALYLCFLTQEPLAEEMISRRPAHLNRCAAISRCIFSVVLARNAENESHEGQQGRHGIPFSKNKAHRDRWGRSIHIFMSLTGKRLYSNGMVFYVIGKVAAALVVLLQG